jgi:hypothetical protein
MSGNSKVLIPPASVDNETCQRRTVPSEDVEAKSAEDADSGYCNACYSFLMCCQHL